MTMIERPPLDLREVLTALGRCAIDERGVYRGLYGWGDAASAEAYVRALWWALRVVSEPDSIHFAVLPEIRRNDLLRDPSLADAIAPDEPTAWWRVGVRGHVRA